MKKSIILDIFRGFRGSGDTMAMPKKENDNSDIIYKELKEKLSPELLKLQQKYVDMNDWCDEAEFYFVEGFNLRLLIGIESME